MTVTGLWNLSEIAYQLQDKQSQESGSGTLISCGPIAWSNQLMSMIQTNEYTMILGSLNKIQTA